MKHLLLLYGAFFCLIFCFTNFTLPVQKKLPTIAASQSSTVSYTYQIIAGVQSTFGYDIYAENKIMIHQPSIPALPGNKGFKTKMAAEKVAQLVIQKLRRGEIPPTVSIGEMKNLKAI